MSHQDDLQRLIRNYNRQLQKLREKKALLGQATPAAILIEIEDVEAEIEKLEAALQTADSQNQPAPSAGARPGVRPAGQLEIYIRNQELSVHHYMAVSPQMFGWQLMAQVRSDLALQDSVTAVGGRVGMHFKYELHHNQTPLPQQIPLAQSGLTNGSLLDLQISVEQFSPKGVSEAVQYRPGQTGGIIADRVRDKLWHQAFGHLLNRDQPRP